MNKVSLGAAALIVALSAGVADHDAKTVLANAGRAMGTDSLTSIS